MDSSQSVFRAVLDCNVLIAGRRSGNPNSPNRELIDLWQSERFTFLFSPDTLHE
jgi:predicted nucleic acid-binding protein